MEGKSLLKSKTFWLNLLGGAVMFLQTPAMAAAVPPQYQALIMAAANVAVRLVTKEPVKIPGLQKSLAPVLLLLILLPATLALQACSTTPYVPPAVCDGSDSLILKTVSDPLALDKGLLALNLAAMKTIKGYTPADAEAVLDQIEGMLDNPGMTYAELAGLILTKAKIANSLAGAVIFIAGDDLERLNQQLPISACDVELVRRHIAKQRALVAIMAAGDK